MSPTEQALRQTLETIHFIATEPLRPGETWESRCLAIVGEVAASRRRVVLMSPPHTKELVVEYTEVQLADVLRYFAKDYKNVEHYEAFVDPVKEKVIFRLHLRVAAPSTPPETPANG